METQQVPEQKPQAVSRPVASVLSVLAGLFRIIPHTFRPFNLSPVGSIGLFGGARLRHWHAFALPIAIMIATDSAMWAMRGFDPDYSIFHYSRAFVYGSFLLYVVIGRLLASTESPWRIGAASVAGSVQFFVITNFGEWLLGPMNYAKDVSGLFHCYVAAVPYWYATLLSDLGFSALLFGMHAWLTRTVAPAERVQVQPVN